MSALPALRHWPVQPDDALPLALWSGEAAAAATGGQLSGPFEVAGIEIDSRAVRYGDLFVALPGERMDGHAFLDDAFANGARAALVDRPIPHPHILVEDTFAALQALGAGARERMAGTVIGVTGSVGKTGVKEVIFASLERGSRGAAHRSVKSYNNHVGVPLSLARTPARSRFAVYEMGMNHAGEIARLTAQVRPHIALITAIAPAHIENLGSEEAIADAKAEIFEGVAKSGTAIIPADSRHYDRLRRAAEARELRIVSFGRADHADMRLLDRIALGNGGSLVTAQHRTGRLVFSIAEPGEHWVDNSLGVMAAVQAAKGELGAAGLALAEMGGLSGRGARHRFAVPGGRATVIDESYNANPASMRATLTQLAQTPANRRIAVLGSMKELGDFSERFHAALRDPIEAADLDLLVLVGEEMRTLHARLKTGGGGNGMQIIHCAGASEASNALDEFELVGGDVVLVKGSNSVGLSAVIAHLTESPQ